MLASIMLGLLSSYTPSDDGSLLYLDLLSTKPTFVLGLKALNLQTLTITNVSSLGPAESFYDQVSVSDHDSYYTTIQHPGAPIDPFTPSSACVPSCPTDSLCCADPSAPNVSFACYAVNHCDKINKGYRQWAETVAVSLSPPHKITARMNTSTCYKLWLTSIPKQLLCIGADEHIRLYLIDMRALTIRVIGTFSGASGNYNEAAAYDVKNGIVYAYLADASGDGSLWSMAATTGKFLQKRKWFTDALVDDFVIDANGGAFAALSARDSSHVWYKMLAKVELAGPGKKLMGTQMYM